MIKTNNGIYIDPKKDLDFVLSNSNKYFVPIYIKNEVQNLLLYYENMEHYDAVVLLKKGSVLENFYLAVIDFKILEESKFNFEPKTILLWDDFLKNKDISKGR